MKTYVFDLWLLCFKYDLANHLSTYLQSFHVHSTTFIWYHIPTIHIIIYTIADKYGNLYTSVPTVSHEIQELKSNILEDISSCNEHELEGISVADTVKHV